uniref:Uncharacterized protein n=1 Tax=viral metagenome TaxID=1070528 RepID=A0A2V0RAC7_9ZZZZ
MERKRNLIRHSFKDGSRGRKQSGPTSAPPPSGGGSGVTPVEEETTIEIVEPVDVIRDKTPDVTRIIDFRGTEVPKDLPIMMSEEDFSNISSEGGADSTDEYEVVLIETRPTLLPDDVDRDIVQTTFPGMDVSSSNELADVMISTGGLVAAPGMPKPNAVIGLGIAKSGDIIKSINSGDYLGAVYDASPILGLTMDEQSGSIDRFVNTAGLVGSLVSGDFDGAGNNLSSPSSDAEERKPSEHIGIVLDSFGGYGESLGYGFSTGLSNVDKAGSGLESAGRGFLNLFSAASKFDSQSDMVRSLPGIRKIEEDRYYTVFFYPRKGITYIEWKPTEDVRNLFSLKRFSTTMREWSEDFIAAAGMKVPAWSRRVKYIKEKYGPESDKVVHYGYSRGGGLATHLGGTGYGTGYFSSYQPTKKSKSKFSGDLLHDAIINPMSYMLLLRKKLRPF